MAQGAMTVTIAIPVSIVTMTNKNKLLWNTILKKCKSLTLAI